MKERIKAWLKKVWKAASIQPEDSKTALTLKLLYIVPLIAVRRLCISIYEMVKEISLIAVRRLCIYIYETVKEVSSGIQKEYKKRI